MLTDRTCGASKPTVAANPRGIARRRKARCNAGHEQRMRNDAGKERAKITAGAAAALAMVGWLVVLAVAFLSVR